MPFLQDIIHRLDVEDRGCRIGVVNGRSDRTLEAPRIPGRASDETRVMKRVHGLRFVDRLPRPTIESVISNVADDADNRRP